MVPLLEDAPVTQEGLGEDGGRKSLWGSLDIKTRLLRSPGVKGPGGHCILRGDRSPVLDITGALVPAATTSQGHSPSGTEAKLTALKRLGNTKPIRKVRKPPTLPMETPCYPTSPVSQVHRGLSSNLLHGETPASISPCPVLQIFSIGYTCW